MQKAKVEWILDNLTSTLTLSGFEASKTQFKPEH